VLTAPSTWPPAQLGEQVLLHFRDPGTVADV